MDEQETLVDSGKPSIYSVSDLTSQIKDILEEQFDFIWIEAEISNFRSPSSGHYYMVFKDEYTQIRAVMFRPQTNYISFAPEDGMKVIARGRISVYQPRGEYQVIIDYLEPLGVGSMALAFEQLKKKLAEKGIFDDDLKRPLPFLPRHVAVITSPTGAAIRDFLNIALRRFTNLEITIIPVKVQGEGATEEIIEAIAVANNELDADTIVITRGGGSMEDLWAFNHEDLAYAIRESKTPVVSAVGHEIDITISDLAADLRAPTPSAAAELLVAEKEIIEKGLIDFRERIINSFRYYLNSIEQSVNTLKKGLRDPRKGIADSWLRLDELENRIKRQVSVLINDHKNRLKNQGRSLFLNSPLKLIERQREAVSYKNQFLMHSMEKVTEEKRRKLDLYRQKIKDLSPYSILDRGYSITSRIPDKKALRSASEVKTGDRVNIALSDGSLECLVENVLKD
ncbi:exodeoxyribonuclease VII large subunit [Thermodesulfobacteriota bacterium]